MKTIDSLALLLAARNKQAVVAAPGGQPQMMPPPGAAPPPGMPMDPAMMGGELPPEPPPEEGKSKKVNVEQEISEIKEMLQALMEAQIAMMQTMSGGMPPPGTPLDPAMMGAPPMDPAMMGGMPSPGMQVTASDKNAFDNDMANYLKSIADLLR